MFDFIAERYPTADVAPLTSTRWSRDVTRVDLVRVPYQRASDMVQSNSSQVVRSTRGFASMDPSRQKEIASKGGRSVPSDKRSFSQNRELAAQAGRKGGQSVAPENRSFSQDRGLAAQAGRKGGQSVHADNRSFSRDRGLAADAGRKGGSNT